MLGGIFKEHAVFTGIIEAIGTIRSVKKAGGLFILTVETSMDLTDTRIGDSVSVDGVCLTVVETKAGSFSVEVTPETLSRSTLIGTAAGSRVNLERALKLGDRLGGHLVQGHVEGIGTIRRVIRTPESLIIHVATPDSIRRYIVDKGSVAVDGISLTVNSLVPDGFTLNIIGHTEKQTTLDAKTPGSPVNIETDIIGRYVEKMLAAPDSKDGRGVTIEKLSEEGYL